ncbi:hypothetical protein FQA39_LY16156 [Lamprigera yunnana]|nr:hypothetical protein FQA39_LY16156 [Lamprigera yunnana]
MNYYLITGITVHLVFSTRSEALVPNQTWYPLKTLFYTYTDEFQCANGSICVRKCCAQNYVITENNCTEKTGSSINVSVYDGTQKVDGHSVDYVVGMLYCEYGYYKLEPNVYPDDLYLVQENGSLWKTATKEFFSPHEYCLDSLADDTSVFLCISEKHVHLLIALRINVVGMIISMPFLLITFLVYAVLPDRNLHGKCLMCYVITLFCAYALLIFIQLYPIAIEVRACKTLGILCLFFFMVSFFWMNVMSIDICWTFSGMRGFSGSRKEAERKRFLVYCGYAWGMPFLLAMMVTGLSISADSDMNAWYNPGMGDGQCWFRDGIPTMLYFYLPMALLIIINLTLFCTTACKIKRVQQDTAMLRKDESNKQSYESDKQRFNLYLKLLLAMGVNWSMEIISWIVDWQIGQVPPPVWYITDFCNALYGVFIFFIFVFKQNIWKLLKRRYYMVIGKPSLARSMTQSAYSPRTTGSSLNHTVSNDKSYVNDSSVLTSEVA